MGPFFVESLKKESLFFFIEKLYLQLFPIASYYQGYFAPCSRSVSRVITAAESHNRLSPNRESRKAKCKAAFILCNLFLGDFGAFLPRVCARVAPRFREGAARSTGVVR